MIQRQVYSNQARNNDEANRRHAHAVTRGHIWDGAGEQIGWIKNGDVFNASNQKFATLDDVGNLYSVDGEPLHIHLEQVNGGGRIGKESRSSAIARFKALAAGASD
jgi:hypothetical protein